MWKRLNLLLMTPLGLSKTFLGLQTKDKVIFILYFIPITIVIIGTIIIFPDSIEKEVN